MGCSSRTRPQKRRLLSTMSSALGSLSVNHLPLLHEAIKLCRWTVFKGHYMFCALAVYRGMFRSPCRKPKDAKAGLSSGLKSAAKGIVGGAVSLFAAPVVMAREEGVKGFAKGVGAGGLLTLGMPAVQIQGWPHTQLSQSLSQKHTCLTSRSCMPCCKG